MPPPYKYPARALAGAAARQVLEPDMDKHMECRVHIERELREAVSANTVAVHYQPLINIEGSRVVGFEALARWISPSFGPMPPQDFIAVAEECGLIGELGDRLLRNACRDAVEWPADLFLSFNLSAIQLRDTSFGFLFGEALPAHETPDLLRRQLRAVA